jgi:hypothetical protein
VGGRDHDVLRDVHPGAPDDKDKGASAVLIAFSMLLLLGILAIALDLSAAFNERNQDQNAGDNGVMAGAIEKAVGDPVDQSIVTNALSIAQANLTAQFPGGSTDPDWIAMWRNCVDDGNPGWIPLPEPASWGSGTLDCISQTTSLLRVRVPDQLVDTSFGAALGVDTLSTHAVSIAKVNLTVDGPPVVPFGVNSGAASGEYCLSSAPSGTAHQPCEGSQTGAFGSIVSPLFGDFGTHQPQCSGNSNFWFARNLAWGLDHRIRDWPHASGVGVGSPWPGQAVLDGLPDVNRDACVFDPDGNPTPVNGIPINTVLVDTGFPDPGLTSGLVSDDLFDGRESRLQQPTTSTRVLRNGAQPWEVDNVGPWTFLTGNLGDECDPTTYDPALPTYDPLLPDKVERFETCLTSTFPNYVNPDPIFSTSLTSTPRFVWAPEYVYDSPPGAKFNPVRDFKPMYLGGVWLNCPSPVTGQPCGAFFYPDADDATDICDPAGPGCKMVTVDQVSSWLFPEGSLPQSIYDDFEATFDNLEPELWQ